MHLDNLAPLLVIWPLLILLPAGLAAYIWLERGRRRRDERRHEELERKYWIAELAYRARLRAREWFVRTKTPRLTYQGPSLAPDRRARKPKRRK
jgi:hypothetical protein